MKEPRPLIKSPIRPILKFSADKLKHRDSIYNAIIQGKLIYEFSTCFCGETSAWKINQYDAYGFFNPTVVCKYCFAMRSLYAFDEVSLDRFYRKYYYAHMLTTEFGGINNIDTDFYLSTYFTEEQNKGKWIIDWLSNKIIVDKSVNVVEVGCGCGGILSIFADCGARCSGCDFVQNYINYGLSRDGRLNLKCGNIDCFGGQKFDLVILSDLVEHLKDPVSLFLALRKLIVPGGFVYINVPGVFGIKGSRFGGSLRQYTKVDHIWCFTLDSLKRMVESCGYHLVTGEDYVRAIFQIENNIDESRLPFKIDSPSYLYKMKLFVFLYTRLPSRLIYKILKSKSFKKLLICLKKLFF